VIPVGFDPVDVVCVDLDGDGDPDLASADQFSFGVSVTANSGDGTFGAPVFYPLGVLVGGLEAGDADGDGDKDILAFDGTDVFALRNNGSGVFFAGALPGPPGVRVSSLLRRIDEDEHLDLVSGHKVWFGSGDFLFPDSVSTGLGFGRALTCDLDRDGDLDIVTGSGIAWSNGNGTFGGVTELPPARDTGAVTCGNYLRNGEIDLVRLQGTSAVELGVPTGFASLIAGGIPRVLPRYHAGDSVWKISAGHVDPDDDLDLVVGNLGTPVGIYDNGSISVLTGNGDGTFEPFVAYPSGDRARSLELADLDGDDDLDAVVGNFDDESVSVLPNDGTGVFGTGTMHTSFSQPAGLPCRLLQRLPWGAGRPRRRKRGRAPRFRLRVLCQRSGRHPGHGVRQGVLGRDRSGSGRGLLLPRRFRRPCRRGRSGHEQRRPGSFRARALLLMKTHRLAPSSSLASPRDTGPP